MYSPDNHIRLKTQITMQGRLFTLRAHTLSFMARTTCTTAYVLLEVLNLGVAFVNSGAALVNFGAIWLSPAQLSLTPAQLWLIAARLPCDF